MTKTHGRDDEQVTLAVLTPHSAPGPGPEFALMTAGAVHTLVRHTAVVPPQGRQELRRAAKPAVLDAAFSTLPAVRPDVVVFASSSTSYALGHRRETALVGSLSARWGCPVVASGHASVAALRRHDVECVTLVVPPWFGTNLARLGASYYRRQGLDVIDTHVADLAHDPDGVTPEQVVDQVSRVVNRRAQAVVLAGNGLRAAEAIAELEERTGRLCVEANQALLWDALGQLRRTPEVRGFGRLFDTQPQEEEHQHA